MMVVMKKQYKSAMRWLIACIVPVVIFYLMEYYTHNPWTEVRGYAQLFNIILFELLAAILLFLTGNVRLALRIEAAAAMLFGLANAYVVRFRGNPLVPWDFYSLKTAASVADNYNFMPDVRMAVVTILFLGLVMALHRLPMRVGSGDGEKRKIFLIVLQRLLPAAVCMVSLVIFSFTLQQESFQNSHKLYNKLFTPAYMTKVDGVAVTFVMNLAYVSVDKPYGYDREEAEKLLLSYETDREEAETEERPNIIVVMNESFSDLAVLGEFETNRDYMPFLHSLQQNAAEVVSGSTVTGMLNVSVCGGNTANTEFEFLTGNTMAFLPQGSVPYQQYIHGEIPSFAGHLQSLGYETVAMHPYGASGWERDEVYPFLGFSRNYFKEDFGMSRKVRNYISDDACIDKIQRIYENKGEQPLFLFLVTMQNHGGYQEVFANFTPDITVDGGENISLEQYLSLIELSDASLEKLIRYFEKREEKTIVVFFGDHQPSDTVAAPILRLNGMQWNQLDEEQTKLRYQVPYVMWANYEIESEQDADTSVNYLAAEILEWAGLPISGYQSFLLELRQKYPILSAIRLYDAAGQELSWNDRADDLNTYQKLQYFQLFDYEVEEDEGKDKK